MRWIASQLRALQGSLSTQPGTLIQVIPTLCTVSFSVEKWFTHISILSLPPVISFHVHTGKWKYSESEPCGELFGTKRVCLRFAPHFDLVKLWTNHWGSNYLKHWLNCDQNLVQLWGLIFPFLVVQSHPARGSNYQNERHQSLCGSPNTSLNYSSSSQKAEV